MKRFIRICKLYACDTILGISITYWAGDEDITYLFGLEFILFNHGIVIEFWRLKK